jgi:probable phosphoglycerate mutase
MAPKASPPSSTSASRASNEFAARRRRRIYLMRHGSVDYFRADGVIVPPDGVTLNALGRTQADAAGALFAQSGERFDRCITSGLPRTLETATRVLAVAHQTLHIEVEPALHEIRGGRLADIPPGQVERAFIGAFDSGAHAEAQRFLGGESVGEMLDRVLPAFERVLARDDWSDLLLVLHGGVNRAIVARALAGERTFFGRLEQAPACINIIDASREQLVLLGLNLSPTQWLHEREHLTTMEKLLLQYLKIADGNPS